MLQRAATSPASRMRGPAGRLNFEYHVHSVKPGLIARHCKPWRDCDTNEERMNAENGLLLTPSIDHLFDRGFIGFEGNGNLIVSPVAHHPSLERMGIQVNGIVNVGAFTSGQKQFLEYHRDMVLLRAARRSASNTGHLTTSPLEVELTLHWE
jgi:hypothetical protein